MRLFNLALSFGLLFGSLALPVKTGYLSSGNSKPLLAMEKPMIAGAISHQNVIATWGRRYCQKPRLTIRAKRLKVERLYRYSHYCRRKILHGWHFYQPGNRHSQIFRVYLYNRDGDLIRQQIIRLRSYSRRGDYRQASLFVSPEVGAVTIKRIESHNRGRHRYNRRNRYDDDDDDD